jgi:hypothetical protein
VALTVLAAVAAVGVWTFALVTAPALYTKKLVCPSGRTLCGQRCFTTTACVVDAMGCRCVGDSTKALNADASDGMWVDTDCRSAIEMQKEGSQYEVCCESASSPAVVLSVPPYVRCGS